MPYMEKITTFSGLVGFCLGTLCLILCISPTTVASLDTRNLENAIVRELLPTYLERMSSTKSSGCECIYEKYDCGCCAAINFPKLGLNDTVCVNVTYLVKDVGMSLTLTIDGKTYVNETVSARNPPPLCVAPPYLKKEASLCVDFYNLDLTRQAFSGCIKLEAILLHVLEESWDLGCFKIPLPFQHITKPGLFEAQQKWISQLKALKKTPSVDMA